MARRIKDTRTWRLVMNTGIALGLLFLVLGITISSASEQIEARAWPSVKGMITQNEVEKNWGKRRTRFECSYTVGDRAYTIRRQTLAKMSMRSILFRRSFPVGTEVEVWHDPLRPERATMSSGLSMVDVGIPILLVGVCCWYVCAVIVELIGRGYGPRRPAEGA